MKLLKCIIILIFLLPVCAKSQMIVTGTVNVTTTTTKTKTFCDFRIKTTKKNYIEEVPGATIREKGTDNAVLSNIKGEFSITLKQKKFPITLVFSSMMLETQEIIIKNIKDTTISVMMKYGDGEIAVTYVVYDKYLNIYSNPDFANAPYSFGAKVYLFNEKLNVGSEYAINNHSNRFYNFSIGLESFIPALSEFRYKYQRYIYNDNDINFSRHKISLQKNCYRIKLYNQLTYSYNTNYLNNNKISSFQIVSKKEYSINKSLIFIFGGIEFSKQFSYIIGAGYKKYFKNTASLLGIKYDTFMNFNFLNIYLKFIFMNIYCRGGMETY